jgi:hypothetical protein
LGGEPPETSAKQGGPAMTDKHEKVEAEIQKRKKEAQLKQIFNKILAVLAEFGECSENGCTFRRRNFYDDDEDGSGELESYVVYCETLVDGKPTRVFNEIITLYHHSEPDDITAYIPGAWEQTLDALWSRTLQAKEQKKKDAQSEEEKNLRKRAANFGINC